MMDKIAEIIRDYAVEYDGDDQGEITAKQIRQLLGQELLERTVNDWVHADEVQKICQLEEE
jgi:hypothetical protein